MVEEYDHMHTASTYQQQIEILVDLFLKLGPAVVKLMQDYFCAI